jgi:ferredoxin
MGSFVINHGVEFDVDENFVELFSRREDGRIILQIRELEQLVKMAKAMNQEEYVLFEEDEKESQFCTMENGVLCHGCGECEK